MLFCREISFVASYAHMGGGSQKVTSDDEGEGRVMIPPKNDDVIYEQLLSAQKYRVFKSAQSV